MRSRLVVALQFLLIAALLVPIPSWQVGAASIAFLGATVLLGAWALSANRLGNFNIRPEPKADGRLVDTGPYRYVRHPMYAAVMLGGLGLVLLAPVGWRIAVLVALVALLHYKAAIEEAALAARHPGYASYRARTARFVPFLW